MKYETKVAAEVDLIVTSLRCFSAEIKQLGLDAGTLTQYLTYGLQQAGFEVICLDARQTAATLAAMRNKTDATMPALSIDRSRPDRCSKAYGRLEQ